MRSSPIDGFMGGLLDFVTNSDSLGTERARGRPIRAGWNKTAAAMVQSSASAISLPMLEVPGSLDSHRLPNAAA